MDMIASMKALPKLVMKSRSHSNSLFIWVLSSFLAIVSLLISFILYSLVFFNGHIKEEIIKYNNLNLKNTTDSYEHQFQLIQDAVLSFSLNDKIPKLDQKNFDYLEGSEIMEGIQNFLSNHSLFLNNMILYFPTNGMALEQSRGAEAEKMFSRYFNSSIYPYDFWKAELNKPFKLQILPHSDFAELDSGNQRTKNKSLIPIVVKNQTYPSASVIALADAQKMYEAFHRSINDYFYILDESHRPFYYSHAVDSVRFPIFHDAQGYVKQGKYYFFYMKGSFSGLTYVNIIPDDTIASQMKWNFSFVLLLVLSVLISVIASLLFSIKLNRPVQRIIDSITHLQSGLPNKSRIKEFKFIQEKVKLMVQTNHDISQSLQMNYSLLRQYAYITKLKQIRDHVDYLADLIDTRKPYRFILFKLTFKPSQLEEIYVDEQRAVSVIREYIKELLTVRRPGSLTFQMENDQILSVVFEENDEECLLESLNEIKQVMELDNKYCYLTIAVSSHYERQEDFNAAYNQVQNLLRCRIFKDDIQIIFEGAIKPSEYYLMPIREEELTTCFQSGNETMLGQTIKREIMQLRKKQATETEVRSFAESLIHKAHNVLLVHQLDSECIHSIQESLKTCFSYEEMETLLTDWILKVTQMIKSKKEKRDHITSFVIEYLEEHYDKDVSLDSLAEKLGITRSYLSTYFKEKTGVYFVDYVNSIRINKAKELLMNSDIKIQYAASRVGYQNINSFNRIFKKVTGLTPSEYRKAVFTG